MSNVEFPVGRHFPRLEVWFTEPEPAEGTSPSPELVGYAEIHSIVVERTQASSVGGKNPDIEQPGITGTKFMARNDAGGQAVDARLGIRGYNNARGRVSLDGYPQNEYWATASDSADLSQVVTLPDGSSQTYYLQGYHEASSGSKELSLVCEGQALIESCIGCNLFELGTVNASWQETDIEKFDATQASFTLGVGSESVLISAFDVQTDIEVLSHEDGDRVDSGTVNIVGQLDARLPAGSTGETLTINGAAVDFTDGVFNHSGTPHSEDGMLWFDIEFKNDYGNTTNRRLLLIEKASVGAGPPPQTVIHVVKLSPGAYSGDGPVSDKTAFNPFLRASKSAGSEVRSFMPMGRIFEPAHGGVAKGATVSRATLILSTATSSGKVIGNAVLHAIADPNATGGWQPPSILTGIPGAADEFVPGNGVNWTFKATGIAWESPGGSYDPSRDAVGRISAGRLSFDITMTVNAWSHNAFPERGVSLSVDGGDITLINGSAGSQALAPIVLLEVQ